MKLIEIDSKKFDKEALKSSEITFHQSSAWAKLKEYNGWKAYYFALEDKTFSEEYSKYTTFDSVMRNLVFFILSNF